MNIDKNSRFFSFFERLGLFNPAEPKSFVDNETPTFPWSPSVACELAQLSKDLTLNYPKMRFFGIGHSPSYVLYGIEQFSLISGHNAEVAYIAFSDRFLTRSKRTPQNARSYEPNYETPFFEAAFKNRGAYQGFLANHGLHPEKIVETFQKFGLRTAIVDNVQSGTAFASFLYFLYSWADELKVNRDSFRGALSCIAISVLYSYS